MPNRYIKGVLFALFRFSALPYLLRQTVQTRTVTIVCYHKPDPQTAERHLDALSRRYTFISLRDYMKSRLDGTRLPARSLIVTFDDGHRSNYLLGPVLRKYNVPATVFLCSGLVGTNRHFWFETDILDDERQTLKHVPDSDRMSFLKARGFSETAEFATPQAVSNWQLDELTDIIDFQSHTVFHPILSQCSAARSSEEISESKASLERALGVNVYALAYPNGDYSDREIEAAEAAGYTCALTLDSGFNSPRTSNFQLKRICINDDATIDELIVKTSGLWSFVKPRRQHRCAVEDSRQLRPRTSVR